MTEKIIKIPLVVALIFLTALVFRLYLSDKAWHVDMLPNAAWGERIYEHGTKSFYSNNIWTYAWPTQPPLINSIYGFNKKMYIELLGRFAWTEYQLNKVIPGDKVFWLSNFVEWFGYGRVNLENPFQIGFLVTMKLIPIFADLCIGWLIYIITKKTIYPLIYLASPFSWYVSSLWGQYDQTSTLFALAAFWLMNKRTQILSPAMLMISILVKPTTLVVIPFYVYWAVKAFRKEWLQFGVGIILSVAIFWVTTAPYTHKNPFEFARYDLTRIVFEKAEPRVNVNSFNFWRIFIGDKPVNSTSKIVFVSWQTIGILLVAIINAVAIWYCRKEKESERSMWMGVFVVTAGAWMFMTGMMDRYLFMGITSGLIAASFYPHLWKYWIGMSVVFWTNLFYHWWVPESFGFLKGLLLWNESFVSRVLSLIMVAVFLKSISYPLLTKLKPGSFQKLPDRPIGKPIRRVGD